MKTGLKRIEATLHDLGYRATNSYGFTDKIQPSFSFRISLSAGEHTYIPSPPTTSQPFTTLPPKYSAAKSVATFPTQSVSGKPPNLPKFKHPTFSNHQHAPNPSLAVNILQDIQQHVLSWQNELQSILREIQDTYLTGPIINGWLESRVEDLNENPSDKFNTSGYWLCSLDAAGKVWSRPCSSHELTVVSLAIARHEKLRLLFRRKQYLENRLSQLAENLVMLHSDIQKP